jgi:hypothetical protein
VGPVGDTGAGVHPPSLLSPSDTCRVHQRRTHQTLLTGRGPSRAGCVRGHSSADRLASVCARCLWSGLKDHSWSLLPCAGRQVLWTDRVAWTHTGHAGRAYHGTTQGGGGAGDAGGRYGG